MGRNSNDLGCFGFVVVAIIVLAIVFAFYAVSAWLFVFVLGIFGVTITFWQGIACWILLSLIGGLFRSNNVQTTQQQNWRK